MTLNRATGWNPAAHPPDLSQRDPQILPISHGFAAHRMPGLYFRANIAMFRAMRMTPKTTPTTKTTTSGGASRACA